MHFSQTDRLRDRQIDRKADRLRDIQIDRKADRQTDRETVIKIYVSLILISLC